MSYQTLPITRTTKAGIQDLESKGAVWDDTTYTQGLKYANDGHAILIARSEIAALQDTAAWSVAQQQAGEYSALLTKTGAGADVSTHLEFTPNETITLNDFQDAMTDAAPEWSFYHFSSAVLGNFAQIEFRFVDSSLTTLGPDHGWLEVTCVPLQGHTGGAAWVKETLAGTDTCGFGGHTPDGSSVFEWAPLTALSGLLVAVNAAWDTAESGEVATEYVLDRIRIELWEAAPARTTYIDTVVIDGTAYAVEPGMAGAKLRNDATVTTLAFVDVRDKFGRFETLSPTIGPVQSIIVGPLLPALFNDSSGYVRFLPDAHPAAATTLFYSVVRVGDPL